MAADAASAARTMVERSCREQGVPLKVEDPGTLARIAAVLRTDQHPAAVAPSSDDPDRANALWLKAVEAARAGVDDRVVEHLPEDRLLAAQR